MFRPPSDDDDGFEAAGPYGLAPRGDEDVLLWPCMEAIGLMGAKDKANDQEAPGI